MATQSWTEQSKQKQSVDIERVQKVAVQVILSDCSTGKSEYTYDMALVVLNLEPLYFRREKLCLKFAKKTLKSRHKEIFTSNQSKYKTRNRDQLNEKTCNTKRCFNSPVNYLTRLLNSKLKWDSVIIFRYFTHWLIRMFTYTKRLFLFHSLLL